MTELSVIKFAVLVPADSEKPKNVGNKFIKKLNSFNFWNNNNLKTLKVAHSQYVTFYFLIYEISNNERVELFSDNLYLIEK